VDSGIRGVNGRRRGTSSGVLALLEPAGAGMTQVLAGRSDPGGRICDYRRFGTVIGRGTGWLFGEQR
jgi:hypothetical protein